MIIANNCDPPTSLKHYTREGCMIHVTMLPSLAPHPGALELDHRGERGPPLMFLASIEKRLGGGLVITVPISLGYDVVKN